MIAGRYGVSVTAIAKTNHLGKNTTLKQGPDARAIPASWPPLPPVDGSTARRFRRPHPRAPRRHALDDRSGVSLDDAAAIASASGIGLHSHAQVGQRLKIPGSKGAPRASCAAAKNAETVAATVRSRTRCGAARRSGRIAARYQVTVDQLCALEQLSRPTAALPGTRLTIRYQLARPSRTVPRPPEAGSIRCSDEPPARSSSASKRTWSRSRLTSAAGSRRSPRSDSPTVAVREGIDRIRAALRHSGFKLPQHRVTINLAPAEVRKHGTSLDLSDRRRAPRGGRPASGAADSRRTTSWRGSSGSTARCGRCAARLRSRSRRVPPAGARVVVPAANADEAALVEGIEVVARSVARRCVALLKDRARSVPAVAEELLARGGARARRRGPRRRSRASTRPDARSRSPRQEDITCC